MASPLFPQAALTWLTDPRPSTVLLVGARGGYPTLFAEAGHEVVVVDRDPDRADALHLAHPEIPIVVGQAESLPFEPCMFDHVVAVQTLHRVAPGLALSEFARVLQPGGTFAVAYLTRDDSVPWVKRLAAAVQASLPDAMRGDYGAHSVALLEQSPYFPELERRTFRIWVPATRQRLIDQALAVPGAAQLSPDDSRDLASRVGAVYDEVSRPPEPIRLPYELTCWRAVVDHTELTAPIAVAEDGLAISL